MGIVETIRSFFKPESENIHDLIVQSEQKLSGWYRDADRLGRFIGYSWACPGKIIRSTMPAPANHRNAEGEFVEEVPIQQRVGCSCVIGTITPDEDGIKNVEAKCSQCGTSSSLAKYLRDRSISARDLPIRNRTTPATQPRVHDTWGGQNGATGDYEYEQSNPGGFF